MFRRSMDLGRTSRILIVERSKALDLDRYYVLEGAAGFGKRAHICFGIETTLIEERSQR